VHYEAELFSSPPASDVRLGFMLVDSSAGGSMREGSSCCTDFSEELSAKQLSLLQSDASTSVYKTSARRSGYIEVLFGVQDLSSRGQSTKRTTFHSR
jgi:hypothetical protein